MKRKFLLPAIILLSIFPAFFAGAFNDVSPMAWYGSYVNRLETAGIVDSVSFFRPAESLNRAEFVKMVIETMGGLEEANPLKKPTFKDVPKGQWYSNYIEAAVDRGFIQGYQNPEGNLTGFFGPEDLVNRAVAVHILVNAFELEAKDGNIAFPDVKELDWFKNDVAIASQNGVVSGYKNGLFGPSDPVTRAQIAKMLVLSAEASDVHNVLKKETEEVPEEATPPQADEEPSENTEEATEEATPNPNPLSLNTVSGDENEIFVSRYVFRANNEGFRVETVTIINDVTGGGMGDEIIANPIIKNITLRFPTKEGKLSTATAVLGSDGKARFTNLNFFAERDEESFFEVYAKLNKLSDVGEGLSGTTFRLGLQEINNTSTSFRAVGDISGTVVSYGNGNFTVSSAQMNIFTVRKSVPTFSINTTSSSLSNGSNTLISFGVSTSSQGSIGLARLVFEVDVSENSGSNLQVKDFQFFRESQVMSNVNIYDGTGLQDLTVGGGGFLTSGTSYVIVSFNQEETVSANSSQNFSLRATINNSETDDRISSRLAQGDENANLSGLTASGQENTGKLYVDGDSTAGIFTSAGDFSQFLGTGLNIIWTDKSAAAHLYPAISNGIVTSDSGSDDFTNGALLGIVSLPDQTLFK